MDTYKSDAQRIKHNIGTIFQKLSNPAIFQQHIEQNKDRLPDEARANLDKVVFGPDSISIESPMGPLKLAIDPEQTQEPGRIVFTAAQAPVKFNMVIELSPVSETETDSVASLQLDLPFFLRGMVGKQLEEGARKFGQMLAMLPYDNL
ncbi:MAG: hypothetical protein IJ160_06365 [Muribaculaceae bacterium]|nr:hypothetical protein [Muribaculaceae bacterium]